MVIEASELALHGGPKVIQKPFKLYNSIGPEEAEAARKVIESGVLSQFLGAWHEDFYGGAKVREFEKRAAEYFNVRHAISVNSATSGLIASVGALGIEPGDEVIVSPWTMCASATAILHWNAIPVFADIDPATFCLDPKSVEANITSQTTAIVVVDIFGQSADMDEIMRIARRYRLKVISDSAQAPSAKYKGKYAGTLGDVGCYSLNYHKHIHTGEGGIVVTNDEAIADRVALIRNHAEAVVGSKGIDNLSNMIGYNFRLGEIESAIGLEQLKKLETLVASRQRASETLTKELGGLRGLKTPVVRPECTHVYYMYPLVVDAGISRERVLEALKAEGVEGISLGYQNIHLLPMYQKKTAYGSSGFPWSKLAKREVNYQKGICPVAEELHDKTFLSFAMCKFELGDEDIALVARAFKKVWTYVSR